MSGRDNRPKREIHAPAKELPGEDLQGPKRKKGRRLNEEMRFCGNVFKELMKKQYEIFMFPFYNPVDPIALNIPTYFDVIKHPMDLSAIKRKMDGGEYNSCDEFEADVRLMFNNCFTFNPPGSDVYNMGQRGMDLFERKWNEKPNFSLIRDSFGGFSKSRKSGKFPTMYGDTSDDDGSSEDDGMFFYLKKCH